MQPSELRRFVHEMARYLISVSFDGYYEIEDGEYIGTRYPRTVESQCDLLPVSVMGSPEITHVDRGTTTTIQADNLGEMDGYDCIVDIAPFKMRGTLLVIRKDEAILQPIT